MRLACVSAQVKNAGCFKKMLTFLNLFSGHVQCFELS
jgi:hypothetical protein